MQTQKKNVQQKKQKVRQVKYKKMATGQACINETIAQIVAVAANAVVRQYWQKEEMGMNLPGIEMKKQA